MLEFFMLSIWQHERPLLHLCICMHIYLHTSTHSPTVCVQYTILFYVYTHFSYVSTYVCSHIRVNTQYVYTHLLFTHILLYAHILMCTHIHLNMYTHFSYAYTHFICIHTLPVYICSPKYVHTPRSVFSWIF